MLPDMQHFSVTGVTTSLQCSYKTGRKNKQNLRHCNYFVSLLTAYLRRCYLPVAFGKIFFFMRNKISCTLNAYPANKFSNLLFYNNLAMCITFAIIYSYVHHTCFNWVEKKNQIHIFLFSSAQDCGSKLRKCVWHSGPTKIL